MNTKVIIKIMALSVIFGLSACASTEPMQAADSGQTPIFSATEAQSMIRVSVRTLPQSTAHESIVASLDPGDN